jgi:ADP-ribose pyrophosphatase YjhB (NUDIX family)
MTYRWMPHVTVAAVIEHGGRFLLVEEETTDGLRLNNPAGHLEPGESPEQGVVREALEETARAFAPQCLVGVYLSRQQRHDRDTDITYLRFAFGGSVGDADPLRRLDKGIVRTVWMTPDELRACPDRHRSPLVMACIDDHLAGRRHPLDLVRTDPSVWGGHHPGAVR